MSPLVIVVGALIGLTMGALGGGGAVLTVPALVYLMGQGPHEATAGSLAIVGVTSVIAVIPHARRGNVRVAQGLTFGALGAAGAFAGSKANALVSGTALLLGFAALLVLVGVLMLTRARRGVTPTDPAGLAPLLTLRPFAFDRQRLLRLVVAATVAGLLTGFFGVGGGFIVVPALVLALSFPMPVAIGTSLLVITINSITGLASRAGAVVDLDWSLLAGFTVVAALASLAGAGLSSRLPERQLNRGFATLLLTIAVSMTAATLLG